MEDAVKKFYSMLLVLAIALAGGVLFAQDAIVDAEVAATKEEDTKEGKKATKAFEMGEIVVKDRAIANIEDASTTTNITGEEIDQRGDKSLGESLKMVSGITVYQTAKGYEGFSMRGFDHKMVAILIDGIPVLDPYYGGNNIDVSTIPVANVSRIIVNRGVASALYGALGSIGSVNIITKKPEELTAAAKVEYGEYQNYMVSAEAGAPIGDFYAWVAASYQHSDGYSVSEKLTKSERRKWFDKLVQYDLFGQAFPSGLVSTNNYLNDTGKWNHTSYSKYQVNGRVGYNITDKIETGVSVYYYSNEQESNTFQSTTTVSWKTTNWGSDPNFATDGRSAAFQNRAFVWPEDTRLTIAPYLKAEFGDLSIRMSVFYVGQRTNLEGWAKQDETLMMFPPSVYQTSGSNEGKPFGNDQVQSIYEETSYGFFLLPAYKIADWNKLSATVHYRYEGHDKLEKAIDSVVASNVVGIHGTGEYKVQDIRSQYVTLALEDEMKFNTSIGAVYVTAGASYDAQDITQLKLRSNQAGTYNQLVDAFYADADTLLWGTRDSLNPVLAAVYDPIKDFLRLRAAGAMKTKFPTLDIYKDITEATDLTIKPERIYAVNGGFELFFLNNSVSFRNDYFYTRINTKIESLYDAVTAKTAYTNIDGYIVQGVESTVQGRIERVAGLFDLSASFGYVYSHARNYDDSTATKGESVEKLPVHQFVARMTLDFITKTSLLVWGNYVNNQVIYIMTTDPTPAYNNTFTTDVYKTTRLHDSFMVNIKLSQKLMDHFEVYVMCKNILDDYNPDPFNPGPGRMFYFGGGAKL